MSAAARRILTATAERLAEVGPMQLTMHDVAAQAEVSKGLIHYHYHDKDTLLARTTEWLTTECLARERELVQRLEGATALDSLWMWLTAEVAIGHRRVLLELAAGAGPLVREALVRSAEARRTQSEETVTAVFAAFDLTPRISAAAIGELFASVVDGLVIAAASDPARDRRAVFDAFWLGVMELGVDRR